MLYTREGFRVISCAVDTDPDWEPGSHDEVIVSPTTGWSAVVTIEFFDLELVQLRLEALLVTTWL